MVNSLNMEWLLNHNLIKQYLSSNFQEKEFRRAVKYTLIIGIQTLYQLHGNKTKNNPHSSFTLQELTSMIISNNGTIKVQSDLPVLSKCLKDIKNQLGDIQNELDHTKSSSNSKKKTVKSNNKIFGNYPKWWPNDDQINDNQINDNQINDDIASHSIYPQIYDQPIAFSIPKEQFNKNNQLHVYLYPEYLQKCLDKNEFNQQRMNKKTLNKKKLNKKNRSKSLNRCTLNRCTLNRCTQSSQAKTFGIPTQSEFLKANNRNIAPCLKYQNNSNHSLKPNKSNKSNKGKIPRYLQNVESRIKKELKKDKLRMNQIQKEKKSFLRDVARYGLDENKNDQYMDEWREKFGSKPSAISVADAIMQSQVIQTMDSSLNNDDSINVNFLSELREWASSQCF